MSVHTRTGTRFRNLRRAAVPLTKPAGVPADVRGLELIEAGKRFGEIVALDDVSLEVRPGSVLGFLGPNGAGKTTAMRAVFGLVELDAGEVLWGGRPVGLTERLRFGYMPEERGLYPRMPLGEQLVYFGSLHGLDDRRGARGGGSSGSSGSASPTAPARRSRSSRTETSSAPSSRRRCCTSPELLVLDEPFAGLDPLAVRTLAEVLRGEAAPRRRGALLEPSARARGGHLRGRRDHRPRPPRRHAATSTR